MSFSALLNNPSEIESVHLWIYFVSFLSAFAVLFVLVLDFALVLINWCIGLGLGGTCKLTIDLPFLKASGDRNDFRFFIMICDVFNDEDALSFNVGKRALFTIKNVTPKLAVILINRTIYLPTSF